MSLINEQEVIAQAQSGESFAMKKLVEEYAPIVYKFAFQICRSQDLAENAMQETFLSVLKNLRQFDNRSKISTWLYTIVSNHCLMHIRREKKDRFVSLDEMTITADEEHFVQHGDNPHEHTERSDTKHLLERAIEKLEPDYRIVFALRDIEGLSTEEVAAITNLSIPALKSRLHRARKFLREELTPYFEEKHYG